jgi:hypothetical protein
MQPDANYANNIDAGTKIILTKERINTAATRIATVSKLEKLLGVDNIEDFKLNNERIFKDLRPHEIDRWGQLLGKIDDKLLTVAMEFASRNEDGKSNDLLSKLKFVHHYALNNSVNLTVVPQKERIVQFLTSLADPNSGASADMQQLFSKLKQEVSGYNATLRTPFSSDDSATYHYYKHKDVGGRELSPLEFFTTMKDHVNNITLPTETMLSQDGSKVFTTTIDPTTGFKAVMMQNAGNTAIAKATMVTFYHDKRIHVIN